MSKSPHTSFLKRTGALLGALTLTLTIGAGGAQAAFALDEPTADAPQPSEPSGLDAQQITLDPNSLLITEDNGPFAGGNTVSIEGIKPGFVQLSAGYYSAMAVTNGGVLYGWGNNANGQLGGTSSPVYIPTQVSELAGVPIKKVSVDMDHSIALTADGDIYAWGQNSDGQLGDGSTTNSSVPVKVTAPSGVKFVDAGAGNSWSAAVGDDGKVYVWGLNRFGIFGNNNGDTTATQHLPTVVNYGFGGEEVKQVSVGQYNLAVITASGDVYTWGNGEYGALGLGSQVETNPSPPR